MRKMTTKVLSFVMIFAMMFGVVGTMPNVQATEDTTSAVQAIVVKAVTMSNATTRETLANNITKIGIPADTSVATRREAIKTAFAGVDAYLLEDAYINAVIAKMDLQSLTARQLIRTVVIEGAPASINYTGTNFKDTPLYNQLNDIIAGGHTNDNGIKFLIKLFQETSDLYKDPIAGDDTNTTHIKFEITGIYADLANALFTPLMESFDTLNNMITPKADTNATFLELLNYAASVVNASSDEVAFKRLLIQNKGSENIYAGSVTIPTTPSTGGGGGGTVTAPPVPAIPAGELPGKVTSTPTADGGSKAVLVIDEKAAEAQITGSTAANNLTLDMTATKGATEVVVELTATMMDKVVSNNKGVEIKTENAVLSIPQEIIKQIELASANQKVTINVNVVKTAPTTTQTELKVVGQVLDFSIKAGDKTVSSFEKNIKAEIKVDMTKISDYRKVIASYYNETTKQWEAVNGYVNKATGVLVFQVNHFSKYAAAEYSKTFADSTTPWAKENIEVLAARNIMNGVGGDKFNPQANITRAEVAAIVTRALNLNASIAGSRFTDVTADKWYAEEVEAAALAGIIGGVGNGKFAPDANITREEIATMLFRALEYKNGKTTTIPQIAFSDASKVSSFAKNAVAVMASKDIIKGSDNKFAPKDNATREQVAVMLYRLLTTLGEM